VDALLKHKPNKDIYKAKRVLFVKPPKGQRMFHIFGVDDRRPPSGRIPARG